jgi:hypothetical protein
MNSEILTFPKVNGCGSCNDSEKDADVGKHFSVFLWEMIIKCEDPEKRVVGSWKQLRICKKDHELKTTLDFFDIIYYYIYYIRCDQFFLDCQFFSQISTVFLIK